MTTYTTVGFNRRATWHYSDGQGLPQKAFSVSSVRPRQGPVASLTTIAISYRKIAYEVTRSVSHTTAAVSAVSPSQLSAHLHDQLERDLQRPMFCPSPFLDPRKGGFESSPLLGVAIVNEESIENTLLAVLLRVATQDPVRLRVKVSRTNAEWCDSGL